MDRMSSSTEELDPPHSTNGGFRRTTGRRRRRRKRFSERLAISIASLGKLSPRLPLLVALAIGWATAPFRRHHWGEVRQLFPEASRPRAQWMLWRALAHHFRDEAAAALSWKHSDLFPQVVTVPPELESLPGPAIIATVHLGTLQTSRVVFSRFGKDLIYVLSYGHAEVGAAVFWHALEALRRGGVALVPVDAYHGARLESVFFGHPVSLARGAFALSRISRVPVIPLAYIWRDGKLTAVAGDPILFPSSGSDIERESVVAAKVMHWLESYLRSHPRDAGLRAIKLFSRSA
jgi:hypothetical protein